MVESALSSHVPFRQSALDDIQLRKDTKSSFLTYVLLAMVVLLIGVSIWKALPSTSNRQGVQVFVASRGIFPGTKISLDCLKLREIQRNYFSSGNANQL